MPKALEAQRDFSAGEIDVSAKRSDQSGEIAPLLKAGLRQALNVRIRNSKAVRNRPGRSALFLETGRVEKVLMSPGNYFYLAFGNGYLRVYSAVGALVFIQAGFPWTSATLQNIVWDNYKLIIYICFPGMQPQILTWDGATSWIVALFSPLLVAGAQNRVPFYRLSPPGITMQPSATAGTITLTFSAGMNLVAGQVQTLVRYIGRQIRITAITSPTTATATVEEPLLVGQLITFTADPATVFSLNDEVIGATTGTKGQVTNINSGASQISVQLLTGSATAGFAPLEVVVGPGGSLKTSAVGNIAPQAVTDWDEEVMNAYRGWPGSCFVDQNRLGLCNFPAVPNGIVWSAIGTPNDLYVGAQPSDGMFELAPDKVQVYYVLAGAESSEFVFTDRKIYYIPISATNPLKPGSVAFNIISSSGCLPVQPRVVDEDMIYVDGKNIINSIVAPGAYYRPYGTRNLTPLSTHLIKSPIAIAIPTQQGTFAEQYIYVLNADGTIAVGKYETENGQIKGLVGWVPWSGAGVVSWIAAVDSYVTLTTVYPGASVVEALDDTVYLDAAMPVNAAPAALVAPPGKGPLWWIAGLTADLMDQATRMMGTYQIDANGFIVPQNNGGENLAAPTLVAGQSWQAKVEPFIPGVPPGPDQHQRRTRRRISSFGAHVSESTGFYFAKIASRIGPLLPPVGTITLLRRVPAWNQDDDPTKPPPLRETAHNTRPSGRDYDPRIAMIKDTPGPIEILEITAEAST